MNDHRIGHLVLRPGRELSADGRRVPMGRKALEILSLLGEAEGAVVTKGDILDAIWPGIAVEENVIHVHVAAIRKALGDCSDRLATVHGIGYQLWTDPPGAPPAAPVAPPSGQPTIAVLKFESRDSAQEGEWFAQGIADEVLTRIAQLGEVRTLARNATFALEGERRSAEYLMRELGATHVVDGSVKRSGERIRIVAQLVATGDYTVMWSDVFDGSSADVFDFQEAVAQAIAAAFRQRLVTPRKAMAVDPETYDIYLRGRQMSAITERIGECIACYREVTERAPDFAQGWGSLALSLAHRARWDIEHSVYHEWARESRNAAAHAIALDPGCASAHMATGLLEPIGAYAARERSLVAAVAQGRADPELARYLGDFTMSVGRLKESLEWFEDSLRVDPVNPFTIDMLSSAQCYVGRFEDGIASYRYAQRKWPLNWSFPFSIVVHAAFEGHWDEVELQRENRTIEGPELDYAFAIAENLRRSDDQVRRRSIHRAEQSLESKGRVDPSHLIYLQRLGLVDEAFKFLERSDYGYRFVSDGRGLDGVGFHEGTIFSRAAAELRSDPRFVCLCTSLGLSRYWAETGRWPDCVDEVPYDFRATVRADLASSR